MAVNFVDVDRYDEIENSEANEVVLNGGAREKNVVEGHTRFRPARCIKDGVKLVSVHLDDFAMEKIIARFAVFRMCLRAWYSWTNFWYMSGKRSFQEVEPMCCVLPAVSLVLKRFFLLR